MLLHITYISTFFNNFATTALLESYISLHKGIRVKIFMEMLFEDAKEKCEVVKTYSAPPFRVPHKNFVPESISDSGKYIAAVCFLLSSKISGLILKRILSIKIQLMRHTPMQARVNIPLGYLKRKRGVLNSGVDRECFHVSVILRLYHDKIILPSGSTYNKTTGNERKRAKTHLESKATELQQKNILCNMQT